MYGLLHEQMYVPSPFLRQCPPFWQGFQEFIHSFIHSFMHAFMHACIHSFIHSFMHACVHACMHACIHSFVRSFVCSFVHSFSHSFMWQAKWVGIPSIIIMDLTVYWEEVIEFGRECRVLEWKHKKPDWNEWISWNFKRELKTEKFRKNTPFLNFFL